MLDGDEGLAQALRLVPNTVVGVGVAVPAAHGLVHAVAFYRLAGAAGLQLLHHAHGAEETLLRAIL